MHYRFRSKKIYSKPEHIKVIHDRDFDITDLKHYNDTKHFRILNDLKDVDTNLTINNYLLRTVNLKTEKQLAVDIINYCYTNISVDSQKVSSWINELRILAIERFSDHAIALGIVKFNEEMKEESLDWIQVLP